MERKTFRERFLNRKTIIILATAVLIIGVGSGAALMKASENPSFCANCHIIKPYYESWSQGSLLANKHARQDQTCQECHHSSIPGKAQEGFNYITGNYTLPLESDMGDRDFCLECHSEEGVGASWDEIKAATDFEESNPHDSHNGEQECNVCHNMHQPSQVMCSECHIFDWMDELDESWESSF